MHDHSSTAAHKSGQFATVVDITTKAACTSVQWFTPEAVRDKAGHGKALLQLFGDERRKIHAAAAGCLQLPRARHAYDAVYRRSLCRERRGTYNLAARGERRGGTLPRERRSL